jgi:hypothetical protein
MQIFVKEIQPFSGFRRSKTVLFVPNSKIWFRFWGEGFTFGLNNLQTMKKVLILSAVFLATAGLIFSSCNAIKKKLNIDIDMGSADVEFTIPVISAAGAVNLGQKTVYLNIDSIIKANNDELSMDNIKSVKMQSCTLTLTDGDAANNFSALESCSALFSSNTNNTPVKIASVQNNPDITAYTLVVPVDQNVDLKEYFKSTSFTYTVSGAARKATTKTLNCKANIRFTVNVGL